MEKAYKVTHKVYYNEKLNKVLFHGKPTYPLYVQVTFDRKTIFFKSNFFELLSKPKYEIPDLGKIYGPDLKEVIKKEDELIDFIVDKNLSDFSLELFKKEYEYYSRDLLDEMEDGFRDYLYTFFQDEGMPWLAITFREGSKYISPFNIVYDMQIAINPKMYSKLIENSFYYAPPYYPLFSFAKTLSKSNSIMFTVGDWTIGNIKEKFVDFMNKNFEKHDLFAVLKAIKGLVGTP
jgi:hypothetical protein